MKKINWIPSAVKIWIPLAVMVGFIAFFVYRIVTIDERTVPKLSIIGKQAQSITAQAIATTQASIQNDAQQAWVARRRPSCRQLPARINRSGLANWGEDEQGRIVQFQDPMLVTFSVEDLLDLWGFASRWTSVMNDRANMSVQTPVSGPLKAKILRAKNRILSLEDVPCGYEWSVVQGIVASYGEHLILREHGDINSVASYDVRANGTSAYQDAKRITDQDAMQMDEVSLSVRMVENATALIFARSVSNLSGYLPDTLDAFRTICSRFNVSYMGFEQAAILWNKGRFSAQLKERPNDELRRTVELTEDVDRGDSRRFLAEMWRRENTLRPAIMDIEQSLPAHASCRFPPSTEPLEYGMELYLPGLSDPVINFVQKVQSDESKVAFHQVN